MKQDTTEPIIISKIQCYENFTDTGKIHVQFCTNGKHDGYISQLAMSICDCFGSVPECNIRPNN